jgi:ribosomal protein L32
MRSAETVLGIIRDRGQRRIMAARQRQTLVVCQPCHAAIHAGRAVLHPGTRRKALESRVLRKA